MGGRGCGIVVAKTCLSTCNFSREEKPAEQKVEEALVSVGDEEGLKKTIEHDELESSDEEEDEEEKTKEKDLGRRVESWHCLMVLFSGESARAGGRP